MRLRALPALALLLAPLLPARGQAGLRNRLDSLVRARLASGPVAGFSVGVVRGTDTLLLKAYGKGEIELGVPTPDRAIYEIGSVTKQFTAVAILQLRDAGKLSLDDLVTKYVPTFDTHGNTVTVRDLLSHTSGIRSYTEMASFGSIAAEPLRRDTLVTLVSKESFDFPTGTQARYNNSAYFLAGLVIEKASGQSYAQYVTERVFTPAGMRDASYCSESRVTPRKVRGYDVARDSLVNHAPISHSWPYAAGSLCASVQDLLTWNAALHGGKVLSAASYQELIAPATLTDGTRLRYAKGLALRTVGGHRMIGHGGAIPGYLAESEYYPDDQLTVVVLANTNGPVSPSTLGVDLAMLVLGRKPVTDSVFTGSRATLVGTYRGPARGAPLTVRIDSTATGLTIARNGGKPEVLHFAGGDTWTREEDRLRFVTEGGVAQIRYDAGSGYYFLRNQ
ncbi:MAG: beta-lactamase family protein [Gemmatimonadaceae bacterium]|nr:beta-lactamase family protein [Gemmatimonadaceae bacterium]